MQVTANTLRGHANLAERMAKAYAENGRPDAAEHFRKEAQRISSLAETTTPTHTCCKCGEPATDSCFGLHYCPEHFAKLVAFQIENRQTCTFCHHVYALCAC